MAQMSFFRRKKKWMPTGWLTFAVFLFGVCGIALVSMRNETRRIDAEVHLLQEQLAAKERVCRDCERDLAALTSPTAVQKYAARELGMTQVFLVGSIRLDGLMSSDGTMTASLPVSRSAR